MIGIVAPSSVVPKIELELGIEQLERAGLKVKVHPNTYKSYRYFAGTDEQRAQALFDFAVDPECDVIWCARGGYGAGRLLPLLDDLSHSQGDPKSGKLLIGYSDATALFHYVKNQWGWSALHGSMPGLRSFFQLTKPEWSALMAWVERRQPQSAWGRGSLRYVGGTPVRMDIVGEMCGGNLAVWTSLLGTRYFPEMPGKILFLEDVTEYPYRIDRWVTQLEQGGGFDGVHAVVLGDFLDCRDHVSECMAEKPKRGLNDPSLKKPAKKTKPIRKSLNEKKLIPELFSEVGERRGFPVFAGLPVGHGPGHFSLPMGGRYRLTPAGGLSLEAWDWLRS